MKDVTPFITFIKYEEPLTAAGRKKSKSPPSPNCKTSGTRTDKVSYFIFKIF